MGAAEISKLIELNQYDWSDVEPHIFGTLFERTLDPAKRSQIGAHYTSSEDIKTLLQPVMMAPLRREWENVKTRCEEFWPRVQKEGGQRDVLKGKESKARRDFDRLLLDFVQRLAHVTVLDPACGSGNFLYIAIRLLLDLQKEVIAYGAMHGTSVQPQVRPTQLYGLEINPFAQELAQVVIWIGYLQWMQDNGFSPPRNPVLEPIESIKLMDSILDLSDRQHPKRGGVRSDLPALRPHLACLGGAQFDSYRRPPLPHYSGYGRVRPPALRPHPGRAPRGTHLWVWVAAERGLATRNDPNKNCLLSPTARRQALPIQSLRRRLLQPLARHRAAHAG